MCITPYKQKSLIITTDRDEKIRVSKYPDTFEILTYCLGHREFISAFAILSNPATINTTTTSTTTTTTGTINTPSEFILGMSGSGDGTICLWNITSGKLLDRFYVSKKDDEDEVDEEDANPIVSGIAYCPQKSLVALIVEGWAFVQLFHIQDYKFVKVGNLQLPSNPFSVTYTKNNSSDEFWIGTEDGIIHYVYCDSQNQWSKDTEGESKVNALLGQKITSKFATEETNRQKALIALSLQQARKHQSYHEHEHKQKKQKNDSS